MKTNCKQKLAYVTYDAKLWKSSSAKQRQNPCSGPPPVYQDLSTRHFKYWPVENVIVDLPIRIEGNSKCTSGNSLSPLAHQGYRR